MEKKVIIVGAELSELTTQTLSTLLEFPQAYTYPLVMRQMWNNSNGSQGAFVVATSASWGIDGANPSSNP